MKILLALILLCGHTLAKEANTQQVETNKELTNNVWRDLWRLRVKPDAGDLVLSTFKVEPDKTLSVKGLPKGYTIQTIHYEPKGSVTKFISYTGVRAGIRKNDKDPIHKLIQIMGFGHSIDVLGLEYDGGIFNGTNEAKLLFRFQDTPTAPTKRLRITLTMESISLNEARAHTGFRSIVWPKLGDGAWSMTLPMIPTEQVAASDR